MKSLQRIRLPEALEKFKTNDGHIDLQGVFSSLDSVDDWINIDDFLNFQDPENDDRMDKFQDPKDYETAKESNAFLILKHNNY